MTRVSVTDLTKDFSIRKGVGRQAFRAVDRVSFDLLPGRTVALVGESGSGKSTIARMLAKLEKPTSGRIDVELDDGTPVVGSLYRRHVQMVFQDPFASLNPFHSVEHHIARPLLLHQRTRGQAQTHQRVLEMLERVNLTPAEDMAARRPHELSGGQRQRVAIARALAPGAQVVIADEPVSMLDVSIRLGVLNLMGRLQREDNLAVLYITHDLATARHFSDEILVLYKGRVVERGPSDQVILDPHHDYTKLLALAAPDPERLGKVVSDEAVPDRAGLDGSVCYNHHSGEWEGVGDPVGRAVRAG
ncbi:ABC transporter ATP-binding protein [Clavibacter michiganensis]|uniref:ABC transporter ATP-binding protein n=1 Tax=Clavibacter michiganensis TaxID=28447 RepID=A0A251XQ34_9MICO|nr:MULTISPECIES: ATP-binding cassette domain-containing protein [Clavibacter]OUE07580.1 Oligopeptide transport ATP-binding protein OppF [Clavibacter michiganensis]PPF51690.1 ABC transporter ATP-binding protein [Clavibacter michiganensis]PPF64789.1 ABC transporter ATP-binding protein [Clavibacter michiganensis]